MRKVQFLWRGIDDEMRWSIAFISDTRIRLGEAARLLEEEIKVNEHISHIDSRTHPRRGLKTNESQPFIPLIGVALWASKRLLQTDNDSTFAFPRYCDETGCKANLSHGGLNKWLHQQSADN